MEQESQMIQGTVLAVIYQNPENGYCVLKVRTEQGGDGHRRRDHPHERRGRAAGDRRQVDAPPEFRPAV